LVQRKLGSEALAHRHARLTSTFVFCTPSKIPDLCIGLTLYLSRWHPSNSASQVCCDV
jgi:hypothetical protein